MRARRPRRPAPLPVALRRHPSREHGRSLSRGAPRRYEWRAVRLHALAFGNGGTADADHPKPSGMKPELLQETIAFIYSPDNMQQVAFGSMDIKLSDGTVKEVPATMRTICKEAIFKDYASKRRDPQGARWFGEKGEPGSFRYNGLGRTKFLEAAELLRDEDELIGIAHRLLRHADFPVEGLGGGIAGLRRSCVRRRCCRSASAATQR